mmetsp:Transcript_12063/g.35812  ORF Transcript_12063/g.35812 Transcript_12063/m.35812 type:complete len:264 (+) Transcript_12063:322-1113(+)
MVADHGLLAVRRPRWRRRHRSRDASHCLHLGCLQRLDQHRAVVARLHPPRTFCLLHNRGLDEHRPHALRRTCHRLLLGLHQRVRLRHLLHLHAMRLHLLVRLRHRLRPDLVVQRRRWHRPLLVHHGGRRLPQLIDHVRCHLHGRRTRRRVRSRRPGGSRPRTVPQGVADAEVIRGGRLRAWQPQARRQRRHGGIESVAPGLAVACRSRRLVHLRHAAGSRRAGPHEARERGLGGVTLARRRGVGASRPAFALLARRVVLDALL